MRRGFTLLEGLFTLGIVFLVLGIAAQLMREYAVILRSSEAKSQSLSSMQVALQQMTDDLRQSAQIVAPSGGGTSLELTFQKVNPAATWLPPTIPNPAGTWNPMNPANLVEVRYYLSQSDILRDVKPLPSGPTDTWTLAQGVAGMQFSDRGDGVILQLSLRETHRTLVITGWSARVKF